MLELIGALATWRVSRMITNPQEEGPFSLFARLRNATAQQRNWVERGLWCILCVSVWAGLFFSLLVDWNAPINVILVRGLAFSAVACMLNRWVG